MWNIFECLWKEFICTLKLKHQLVFLLLFPLLNSLLMTWVIFSSDGKGKGGGRWGQRAGGAMKHDGLCLCGRDIPSRGFIIQFLSVMDFTDYHCLRSTAALLRRNRTTTGGVVLFPSPPSRLLPSRNARPCQIMWNGSEPWVGFKRLTVFRFNVKQTYGVCSPAVRRTSLRWNMLNSVNSVFTLQSGTMIWKRKQYLWLKGHFYFGGRGLGNGQ